MARITSPIALELERLLRQRRALASALLNADAFDRWGPKDGPEYDEMMAAAAVDQAEHKRVTAELETRTQAARAEAPAAVQAWADAHIDLLTRFIAANADEPNHATACYVANKEREAWHEVKRGSRGYVDENCYYIHLPAEALAEWFGS